MDISLCLLVLAAPAAAQFRAAPARTGAPPVAIPVAPLRAPSASVPSLSAPSLTLPAPTLPSVVLPAVEADTARGRAPSAAAASGGAVPAAAALAAPAARSANAAAFDGERTPEAERARGTARQFESSEKAAVLDSFFDGSKPMSRPAVEAWTVGGTRYESTARLVKELPDSPEPLSASYEYGVSRTVSRGERAANAGIGAVAGAVAGGIGGTLFGLVGSFLGSAASLFLFGDPTGGVALGAAGLLVLAFAAIGAAMGVGFAWEHGGKPSRGWVGGDIFRHDGRLLFRVAGADKLTVDLEAFAAAGPAAAPAPVAPWPLWKRAAAGLGAGLAVALANAFPLVQIIGIWIAGPAAGLMAGHALSAGTEVRGGVLGGALGALVPVTMFAVLAAAPYGAQLAWLGWWVLAVAGLGTLFGAALADPIRRGLARREAEEPSGQWWTKGGRR